MGFEDRLRELAEYRRWVNRGYRLEAKTLLETTFACSGNGIRVRTRPHEQVPHTYFRMQTNRGVFDELLLYSHIALGTLVTGYQFDSVLEIGSRNGTAARAFEFLGKRVFTVEILEAFGATCNGDYLDVAFPEQFDAIWCSHVLEHQRHLGRFCEKMFDDLKEGGVLALTVPAQLSPLFIGHCNIFTPLHLIYNLVLAGFDCSDVRVKCYDSQLTVLLRKKSNGLARISFATTHYPPHVPGTIEIGSDPSLLSYFPPEIAERISPSGEIWGEIDSINWD